MSTSLSVWFCHAVLSLVVPAPQVGSAAREWSQPLCSAASSSCVDVAPLATSPQERWRVKSERVLAGPVVLQGKVFAAVRLEGNAHLLAIDAASGHELARIALASTVAPTALAAAEGLVLLFEASAVHGYRQTGSEFKLERSVTAPFAGWPSLAGTTWVGGKVGGGMQLIDFAGGKCAALVNRATGRPALPADGSALFALEVDTKANQLALLRWPLSGTGAGAKAGSVETIWRGGMIVAAENAAQAVLVGVQGKAGPEWCGWFGDSLDGGMLRKDALKPLKWRAAPAAAGSRLYGFDSKDQLIEFDAATDTHRVIVDRDGFPSGAKVGAPSIARGVLFVGNWALEMARKKVLWCVPELDPQDALIPAGNELLVARLKSGELVGLGRAPEIAVAGARPRIPTAVATEVPGTGAGLIRTDGLFVPGKVSALPDGRFQLQGRSGASEEYESDWVAAVDSGSEVKRLGEEQPLYRAFWNVLAPRHADALVPVIEKLRDAKLNEEGRRVLEEARRFGLAADRADAFAAALAGKGAAKGGAATAAKKACAEAEADVREASVKAFRAGARWCAAQKAFVAATALVARAIELNPAEADYEIVEDWMAPDFPRQDDLTATFKDWVRWADALLPSGGRFAKIDDSLARRLSVTKFKEDTIVLETRNIRLISRENDPKVISPLLVRGEATVRALQKLLGESPMGLSTKTLLEVRLYKTRAEYLADSAAPPEWSGGCYSPNDSISRFFAEMGDRKSDPVQHTLEEVFAHELTHHYTDVRWLREKRGADSGSYWMVEGFAEFVASQALEIGRLGESFDDATVEPIDKTAAVARVNPELLLDMNFFLGLDAARFHSELADSSMGSFKLKHTLTEVPMTQRGLFYAQATAFTFFVIHRTPGGHARYVEWLKRVYSGTKLVEPWKELGFATSFELRTAFREFLAGV